MRSVPLGGAKAHGRAALVDDDDFAMVSGYAWHLVEKIVPGRGANGPYAASTKIVDGKFKTLLMHKLLTGWARTDHADHDGLNNQRYNLREASSVQNGRNQRPQVSRKSSQYKGVRWETRHRKWVASIKHGGKKKYLGSFANEIDAARAYDAAALELFGEFAYPNFPAAA